MSNAEQEFSDGAKKFFKRCKIDPYAPTIHMRADNGVTNDDVQHLKEIRNIKHLWFTGGEHLTSEALNDLPTLDTVHELSIYDMPDIDKGIAAIERLHNVKSITISNIDITDKALKHIGNLKNLEEITAEGKCSIMSSSMAHLKSLDKLKTLNIEDGSQITGLDEVGKLVGLKKLSIYDNVAFSDQEINKLENLHELESLAISGDNIGDETAKLASNLPNIKDLSIDNNLTDEGMKHIGKIAGLETLYIAHNKQITDRGMNHLKKLHNLVQVEEYDKDILPNVSKSKFDEILDFCRNNSGRIARTHHSKYGGEVVGVGYAHNPSNAIDDFVIDAGMYRPRGK